MSIVKFERFSAETSREYQRNAAGDEGIGDPVRRVSVQVYIQDCQVECLIGVHRKGERFVLPTHWANRLGTGFAEHVRDICRDDIVILDDEDPPPP